MGAVTGIWLLAHCGAKWWACDVGSAITFIVFVAWCVIGLRRLERRTEARAKAHREAQAKQMRSTPADDDAGEGQSPPPELPTSP